MDALPFAVVRVAFPTPDRVTRHPARTSPGVFAHGDVAASEGGFSAERIVMHPAVLAGEPYGFSSPVEGLDGEFSLDLYIGSHLYIPSNGCIFHAAFNRMGFHYRPYDSCDWIWRAANRQS